jgi:16S rRNA processing protein RimM
MSASSQARQPEQSNGLAGSPESGEPVFLVVGKLRKTHGLHGEIRMEVITDFPERLDAGEQVYVGDDHCLMQIRSVRWHNQYMLIAFDGYTDPESVSLYRNKWVFVRADDRPALPDGEYYHHQLLGLNVVSDDGDILGELTQILETGANDVYVIRPSSGPDLLIPAVDGVILQVDLDAGCMRVHLLPGLRPED